MSKLAFDQKELTLGGIIVHSRVLLGAGIIKNPLAPELAAYLEDREMVGAVTIGSITSRKRDGNKGVLNWPAINGNYETFASQGGLHANGMRNLGIAETMDHLPPHPSKPLILSIAGYSTEDYISLLQTIQSHKNSSLVKAIEVNCSCPTMDCAPLAYSLEALEELCVSINKLHVTKPLWFKLSPYFIQESIETLSQQYSSYDFSACPVVTEEFLQDLQKLLKEHASIISAVIISNGLPQVGRHSEIKVEKEDGTVSLLAGLSGVALKERNIEVIKSMKMKDLPFDIIGCGGVLTQQDVSDYLKAGAVAVQCSGGPFWGGGVAFFDRFTK
jgi:dihydroorotate dehydrogenase (NAD+) catalytic subunit